jgi:glycosyltransferase involved in cell wall biosynthesis
LRDELGIPRDAKVVLSPKILSPFYNVDIMVESMAKVVEQEPAARLVVTEYGATPDYRLQLDHRIAALGLQQNVTFVGKIAHERMPLFYSMADVSVGIPKSDGLPQTLLEAMACGVPNVVGRLHRYGEIVQDGESALFADITPEGVADAVLRLLRNPELSRRVAEQGRKIVIEQANFPRDVAKVENAYYELTSRRNLVRLPRPMMLSDVAMYWLGR